MEQFGPQRVIDQMLRYYEDTLVCLGDVHLSFTICYIDDCFCMVLYECGDSIKWNLETGEVSTL